MATGEKLNPQRKKRIPLGLKSDTLHHVITHNPSSANPKDTLYVRLPRLTENTFFVPDSIYLSVDVGITGDSKNSVVNNLGRNLISKMVVKWGAETILQVDNYNLYNTFKDLWLTKEKRDNMVFQGIQPKNLAMLRSGVATADIVGETADEKTLNTIFGNKYKIPLDFELLTTHAPVYKFPIQEDIIFELKLAPKEDIIVTATTAKMNYELKNICLEYDTISNETIARQLVNNYNAGFSLYYDWIDHFKTLAVSKNTTLINENVNIPKRSIKGILLLFISDYTDGDRDSEKFENPMITKVKVTIEGISNKLYPEGMRMLDQWEIVKKHFMSEEIKKSDYCNLTLEKYYGDDNKFGLWLDLRSTEDNTLHGSGKSIQNTKDGIQLAITKSDKTGPYKMHIFIVSDSQFNVQNCQITSVQH